jgi:hypothetical protein
MLIKIQIKKGKKERPRKWGRPCSYRSTSQHQVVFLEFSGDSPARTWGYSGKDWCGE